MRNVLNLFRPALSVGQIRDRHFRTVRHGLDPAEVHTVLYRVARFNPGVR